MTNLIIDKPESGTGIKHLYINGFDGVRVMLNDSDGVQYIKDFAFSSGHPQDVIIRAVTDLHRVVFGEGKAPARLRSLIMFVKSDEFWSNFYKAAAEYEKKGRYRKDRIINANALILSPITTTRKHGFKNINLSISKGGTGVAMRITSWKKWIEKPDVSDFNFSTTVYGYSELFRVAALFTALGLCLLDDEVRESHGKEYVLGVYFRMISEWRMMIEKGGVEFFFDKESSQFNLTIDTFIARVDAELSGINSTSIFNSDITNVLTLQQHTKVSGSSFSIYSNLNQNRELICNLLNNAFPSGFNTQELKEFTVSFGVSKEMSTRLLGWKEIVPYLKKRNGKRLYKAVLDSPLDDNSRSMHQTEFELLNVVKALIASRRGDGRFIFTVADIVGFIGNGAVGQNLIRNTLSNSEQFSLCGYDDNNRKLYCLSEHHSLIDHSVLRVKKSSDLIIDVINKNGLKVFTVHDIIQLMEGERSHSAIESSIVKTSKFVVYDRCDGNIKYAVKGTYEALNSRSTLTPIEILINEVKRRGIEEFNLADAKSMTKGKATTDQIAYAFRSGRYFQRGSKNGMYKIKESIDE